MEHSQANIDALRSEHERANSRMFPNVLYPMELFSPGGFLISNTVKLTLMP